MIENFLQWARVDETRSPKAIIVPHAGYIYSGAIAASAYARFVFDRRIIKRVILIGPSHYATMTALATSSAQAFATPLGEVCVDEPGVRQACQLRRVTVSDEAHREEHSLEVQLPFLQYVLEDFQIVPLLAVEATGNDVAEVIESLWGGPETRFVISSDLSHHHSYDEARRLDFVTSRNIEQLRANEIREEHACGWIPIRGLLGAARRRRLHVRTVDLRNSGDTAGPSDRVVGYGAFLFEE